MRNFDPDTLAYTINSPLRHAGASTPFTLGHARTPISARFCLILFAFSACAWAQSAAVPVDAGPPVLRYAGQPIRVPFECAEEELQSVGLVCTEDEPCSIFLELSGIASAGKKLFLAGNMHAQSGTIASIFLSSGDNGTTWREPVKRFRGSAIEQVEFYDLEHGWASGGSQYPLPRDPFFLVTTDGGQTWRNRPLTEDGGAGSIQRFWFDSAQHGEMFVDAGKSSPGGRYHAYESQTGGESWMIRGLGNQVPTLKHVPPPSAEEDLRVRASASAAEWLVERRNGEKWETVASFLIESASCKIKPVEAKEPLPEPEMKTDADPDKDYVEEIKLGTPAKSVKRPTAPAKKKP